MYVVISIYPWWETTLLERPHFWCKKGGLTRGVPMYMDWKTNYIYKGSTLHVLVPILIWNITTSCHMSSLVHMYSSIFSLCIIWTIRSISLLLIEDNLIDKRYVIQLYMSNLADVIETWYQMVCFSNLLISLMCNIDVQYPKRELVLSVMVNCHKACLMHGICCYKLVILQLMFW